MEAGEENSGNVNLKRQREPLSDSEDNIFSGPAVSDAQKRRRLETAGRENRSPKPSSSGRLAELGTKPDTPIVPSIRSRVQLLTQRRDGGSHVAQRCFSDPGTLETKSAREPLLSEGEFNQRMERFKAPTSQVSPNPTLSPISSCPRTRSNFVSDIQQKLQSTTTPSSKQATRMRQERELELNQMQFQPISENAWLKRSSSDSSLTQGRTPTGSSSPFSWVPRSQRRVWPPMQPWDQVHGDAEMKDGSFTEAPATYVEKPSAHVIGQKASSASETPSSSGELEQGPNSPHGEDVREQKEHSLPLVNDQKHLVSDQSENQTILKLSFSEDQKVMGLPTAEKQSFLESTVLEESDTKEARNVSGVSEEDTSKELAFDEEETMDISSFGEDEIEPSTDEELKMWRYPQGDAFKDAESIIAEQHDVCVKEEEELESSRLERERNGFINPNVPTDTQDGKCPPTNVSGEIVFPEKQGDEKPGPEQEKLETEICIKGSVKDDQVKLESGERCCEDIVAGDNVLTTEEKNTKRIAHDDDASEQSGKNHAAVKGVAPTLMEAQTGSAEYERNIESDSGPSIKVQAALSITNRNNGSQSLIEIQASNPQEMEREAGNGRQEVIDELTEEICEGGGREGSKRVTFILEPELINTSALSEVDTSVESRTDTSLSDAGLSSHNETSTAEVIDQMFEEVLEYAGRVENERLLDQDGVDCDSGIVACSGGKDNMDTEVEKSEETEAKEEECGQNRNTESNGDELLTFPPAGILSPLSKSVEAVVTPLRLATAQESNPSSLLLTPDETNTPPAESAPLYSIDAYRSQRQNKLPTIQSVTPVVQRRAPDTSKPQTSVNTKEKIAVLNEEAGKLQTVISQTLQALSCCTDEEHGRGSLEEAEAEKLLLVSCEKHSALLAEVARLREERSSESEEAAKEDTEYVSQQPCRGTVCITNIQLPLKVEFVCSSHNRTGRPSHYFFVLIRYGPYNIVATPLATAADAQNGDTISFPTSVTLKDIRPSFEIEVEVYSLAHTSGTNCSVDRTTTKSRVTPRKLLNTITRSSNSLTGSAPVAINTRRTSNFCLVGSHKITLASLGLSKFPLDKMKFEGKIRRLLGDEFQEKVPFLSPLEGNIYLQLDSKSHSNVQHQGFLTMFELISGYGVWHRRYFVLEGCNMYYWNNPNDRETKEAEGGISLSRSPSQCVRPVKRDSCARPFTFELVSNVTQQQDHNQEAFSKCWFSADTKQERLDWMEKLSQALLDFHTWNQSESRQTKASSSGSLRESML